MTKKIQFYLEPMEFPDPVIEIAVEPKTKGDQEKMGEALARLAKEDPSFRVSSDEESGQTIIKGMGELHLDIIVDRMKREFKVEANVGAPQVAYRETIEKSAELNTYIKNKVVVLVNLLKLNYLLNLKNQVKEEKLKVLLKVELFQKNLFLVLKKV